MNTAPSYQVNSNYTGQRSVLVPTKMYSRNAVLGALHVSSKRYLGVDLDRFVLTFNTTPVVHEAKNEIAFSHLRALETDVTRADSGKYFLTVKTDEGDLKFKFKNAADFHAVVDALSHTTMGGQPVYAASEGYKAERAIARPPAIHRSDSVSSEDLEHHAKVAQHTAEANYLIKKDVVETHYDAVDDLKKRELQANKAVVADLKHYNKEVKNDEIGMHRDQYRVNKDLINETKADFALNRDLNEKQYEANKEAINQTYAAAKATIEQEYERIRGTDAHAKVKHDAEIDAAKALRDAKLAANKETYKANRDAIKHAEHLDKARLNYAKDQNEVAFDLNKGLVKDEYNAAQASLNQNLNAVKDVNKVEREIIHAEKKTDLNAVNKDLETDARYAGNIKDTRY